MKGGVSAGRYLREKIKVEKLKIFSIFASEDRKCLEKVRRCQSMEGL